MIGSTTEILRENPFGTAYGQDVVSVSESFWARLSREGRPRNAATSGSNIVTGSLQLITTLTASKGCLLYPRVVSVSTNVDGLLCIRIDTKIPDIGPAGDGVIAYYIYAKAGTPVTIVFDGEVFCLEDGSVAIGANPDANGKVYGTIIGVEVPA